MHLRSGFDIDATDARWGTQIDRATDQHHLGAQLARGLSDGITHLAGAAVGDETHRVYAFTRGSGRQQHALARQRPLHREQRHGRCGQRQRLDHATLAGFAAGLTA